MDINPEAFKYEVFAEKNQFYIGMRAPFDENIIVKIHGENANGKFEVQ